MDYLGPWESEYRAKGRIWRRETTDLPALRTGDRVLELGCGDGKTLLALSRLPGIELVGLDISPTALDLAREALDRIDGSAHVLLVRGDVRALPFEDGHFSAVFAYHIFDHLTAKDRERAVAEAVRVLAPGGLLHFRGFSTKDLRAGRGTLMEEGTVVREPGLIYHYFEPEEVRVMLSALGLTVLSLAETSWEMGGKEALRRALVQATAEKE